MSFFASRIVSMINLSHLIGKVSKKHFLLFYLVSCCQKHQRLIFQREIEPKILLITCFFESYFVIFASKYFVVGINFQVLFIFIELGFITKIRFHFKDPIGGFPIKIGNQKILLISYCVLLSYLKV